MTKNLCNMKVHPNYLRENIVLLVVRYLFLSRSERDLASMRRGLSLYGFISNIIVLSVSNARVWFNATGIQRKRESKIIIINYTLLYLQ